MKEFEFDRNQLSEKLLRDYLEEEERANRLEEDSEEGVAQKRLGMRFYLATVGIILAVSFFVFAWSTDQFALTSNSIEELPLIRADQTPVKVKPKDPGGLKIANMDKAIYQSLDSKKKELPKVVRILPKPEEPIVRGEITLRPITEVNTPPSKAPESDIAKKTDAVKKTAEEEVMAPEPKQNPLLNKNEQEAQVNEVLTALAANAPAATPEVAKVPATEAAPKLKQITAEDIKPAPMPRRKTELVAPEKEVVAGHRVQLGAFRNMEDLTKTWNKLRGMFPGLFDGKQKFMEKADLGDKGVFYRLQLGPMEDAAEGRAICQKLTEKKQGCFFVKR